MYDDFACVEGLESRRMLSGTARVVGNVLRVSGDLPSNNVITVANNSNGTDVDVTVRWTGRDHVSKSFNASFAKTTFTRVYVRGGVRADTVNFAQTGGAINARVRVDTLRGDDTVNTGDEADLIYAGVGNDTVTSNGGNDLIHGGAGNDLLTSGDGNDSVLGGGGNDNIDTGAGDDKLGGVHGSNNLTSGTGHDTFYVVSLSANASNDFDSANDTLVTNAPGNDNDGPPGT